MANPYVNKVEIKNGPVLIDLTSDTVRTQDVAAGVTFHLPTGETATGTGTDSVGLEKLIDRTISRVSHLSVTTIASYLFFGCSYLTDVNFPACKSINEFAFRSCTAMTDVSFPECTTIGASAFRGCSILTTIAFPKCTTIGQFAFAYSYSIAAASFPMCKTIASNAFKGCTRLAELYLMGSSVVSLGAEVFASTPIGGYSASAKRFGSVYVPASLLTAYQAATNWSSISSRITGV